MIYFFLFFWEHDFYFLIIWVIALFFGCLLPFCFNWQSFFNKGLWVNLYKFTFSIPLFFHFQLNKYFSIKFWHLNTVPIFWHLNTQPKTRQSLFFNKILIQCMLVPKRKWMAEHHCNLNDEYMYIRQCGVVGQGGLNIYTWGSLRRQRYCWNFIIQYHFRN